MGYLLRGAASGIVLWGCCLTTTACGHDGGVPEALVAPRVMAQVEAAPDYVTIRGQRIVIADAELWRNFQPETAGQNGDPLVVDFHLRTTTGAVPAEPLRVDVLWVVNDGDVWSATVGAHPDEPLNGTPQVYYQASDGPRWATPATVDLIVRVYDAAGRAYLIKAAGQTVIAVS